MNRPMLGRGVVVVVVVVAGAPSLLGLRAARIRAYRIGCQSQLRQLGYGSMAYACDWSEVFPTRVSRKGGVLNGVYRLPFIGFDTATIVGARGSIFAPGYALGGWAFLFRDYVKNDYDLAVCPDGWYAKDDFLKRWDGRDVNGLYSEKMSYLWLAARDASTAVANGQRSADGEIPTTASDKPDLHTSADYVLWAGAGSGFGISGNHQRNKARAGTAAGWPTFDPAKPSDGPAEDRPSYSTAVRIDCRSSSREFLDLSVYRYIVDVTPRVHVW